MSATSNTDNIIGNTASPSGTEADQSPVSRRSLDPVTVFIALSVLVFSVTLAIALVVNKSARDSLPEEVADKYGAEIVVPDASRSALAEPHEWAVNGTSRLCTYASATLKCIDADGAFTEIEQVTR